MAVTAEKSAEFTDHDAALVVNIPVHKWGGRLRARYFKFTQGAADGDANSTQELVRMPAGNVRILGQLSTIYHGALTATATLDVGHRAYVGIDGVTVAQAEAFFASAVDVDAAGSFTLAEAAAAGVAHMPLISSREGFTIYSKNETASIPAGTVIEGVVVYVVD